MKEFFMIRAKFYFQYFSQFNIQQIEHKFHSLLIPLLFILYHFVLKMNCILERLWILNMSGVHDIIDFVPESEYEFSSCWWTQQAHKILNCQ
jgi:hypothetical protein